jgi:hypothetical protein
MEKWEKLYSNLWIRIPDDNFHKLVQIQKDYQLKSVEEVLDLLVNENTINSLAAKSKEYSDQMHDRICHSKSPANN